MTSPSHVRDAFSLVELSIVLVILGLLVGGVLSGQSLIKAAELRSVNAEHAKFVAALHSFRDKYFAKPGDMTNATQFWGAAAAPATCYNTAGTGTQTCDGNGDGWIWGNQSPNSQYEELRAWQQLANAGLIEGQYAANSLSVGANYPRSKFKNARWTFAHFGTTAANSSSFLFGGDYGDSLLTSDQNGSYHTMTGTEAWNIDKKVDDGLPGTGSIASYKDCTSVASTTTDAGATYTLNSDTTTCLLLYKRVI